MEGLREAQEATEYLDDAAAAEYLAERYKLVTDVLRLLQTLARAGNLQCDFKVGRSRRWSRDSLDAQVLAGALER